MNLMTNTKISIMNWIREDDSRNVSRLSTLSGISRATIRNIQTGRNAPRLQTAYKILMITEGSEKALCYISNNQSKEI